MWSWFNRIIESQVNSSLLLCDCTKIKLCCGAAIYWHLRAATASLNFSNIDSMPFVQKLFCMWHRGKVTLTDINFTTCICEILFTGLFTQVVLHPGSNLIHPAVTSHSIRSAQLFKLRAQSHMFSLTLNATIYTNITTYICSSFWFNYGSAHRRPLY